MFTNTCVHIITNERASGIHATRIDNIRCSSTEGPRNKPLPLGVPQMVAHDLLISMLLTQ